MLLSSTGRELSCIDTCHHTDAHEPMLVRYKSQAFKESMSEGMDAWGVGIFPAVVRLKIGEGPDDWWFSTLDYIGHLPDHGPATTSMLNLDILRRAHEKAKELNIKIIKIIRWSDGQRASFKVT